MWHCDSRRRKVSRDVTRTPRILHGGTGGLEINDGKRNGYHPLSTASIIMYVLATYNHLHHTQLTDSCTNLSPHKCASSGLTSPFPLSSPSHRAIFFNSPSTVLVE